MTIRNLIADDHGFVRQRLRTFLREDPELEVVGEPANGAEAVQHAYQLKSVVVLMDSIAATATTGSDLPDTEVLAIATLPEDTPVAGAIQTDAIGSLFKGTEACALCQAIKAARGYN